MHGSLYSAFLTALSQIMIFSNNKMITKDAAVFIFTSGCMNKMNFLIQENMYEDTNTYKFTVSMLLVPSNVIVI